MSTASSTEKLTAALAEGAKMGLAAEGVDVAYRYVSHIMQTKLGISKEMMEKPMNKELILMASMAILHMGSHLLDETLPGMDNVRHGCELVIKGKTKDYTQMAVMTLIPGLLQAADLMNPEKNMVRLAEDVTVSQDLLDVIHATQEKQVTVEEETSTASPVVGHK